MAPSRSGPAAYARKTRAARSRSSRAMASYPSRSAASPSSNVCAWADPTTAAIATPDANAIHSISRVRFVTIVPSARHLEPCAPPSSLARELVVREPGADPRLVVHRHTQRIVELAAHQLDVARRHGAGFLQHARRVQHARARRR